MPAVVKAHPSVRLVLAGDGPLGGALERQARELGLDQVVKFLGYRHDVPDLVQAADVFVLPSLMEGLCSTLVDVMLARRPIVACSVGGVPEVLDAEASSAAPLGRLVAPGNAAALAIAICETIDRLPSLGDQLDQARECALRQFTTDRMVDETLAVYQDVLIGSAAA